MLAKTTLLALAAATAAQAAAPMGFNYGSSMNGVGRTKEQFLNDFKGAQKLAGTNGQFNSARLYTMIDGVDPSQPIRALEAAMETQTYLLLGLWASGDPAGFKNEITQLQNAIKTYPDLAKYVLGISVGSEDLYRITPTGLAAADAAPGQGPDTLVDYIKQTRDALKGSSWSDIKVGHVDTWTAWVNGSNSAVIDNSDFLGVDAYPYYQKDETNGIDQGKRLFNEAMDNTKGVAKGKEVWITETGWAYTGPVFNLATPGKDNSQTYWNEVGCPNFGNTPTFWYTLYDGVANNTQTGGTPSFSVATSDFTPLYDLSCSNVSKDNNTTSSSDNSTSSTGSSSNGSSSSGTSTGTAAKSTGTGSASSGSSNGTYTGSPNSPSGTSISGSGSGSSGTGASGSGTSSGSGSTGSGAPATGSAATLSISLGSMAALAAGVVALL